MQYNTARARLNLSEYGRNVQEMVNFALTIEDKARRQKVAEQIVELMAMLNPQLKMQQDYKQKLWDHLLLSQSLNWMWILRILYLPRD